MAVPEAQIRHQLHQLSVLLVEPLQPPDLGHADPGELHFQRQKVSSEIPIRRQISSTEAPDSACLKAKLICSSV